MIIFDDCVWGNLIWSFGEKGGKNEGRERRKKEKGRRKKEKGKRKKEIRKKKKNLQGIEVGAQS